jgi:tRNA nucleotidyltransferase (CCA-adding enzyme)
LFDFYKGQFDFLNAKSLKGEDIERIIVVDTANLERVAGYFHWIEITRPKIVVYDHHAGGTTDIPGAALVYRDVGANTSQLVKMAKERDIVLTPEEATIAMTGIYADTGRLSYDSVRAADFEAASWLLEAGASLSLVKSFLETVREDNQIAVLNQVLQIKTNRIIRGHSIDLSYLELDSNVQGLSAVVEKVMELSNPDAYFALFYIRKTKCTILIARSQQTRIDLKTLLAPFGGGGHQLAASALVKNRLGPEFFEEFVAYLQDNVTPAIRARDIMIEDVECIEQSKKLIDLSKRLEVLELSGLPVVEIGDGYRKLVGFITLKDISKGRKANAMNAPVSAYMTKPAISARPEMTLRELERIFYKYHIERLPVVENERLIGIVSRWDYLTIHKKKQVAPEGVAVTEET